MMTGRAPTYIANAEVQRWVIAIVVILLLVLGGLAYFLSQKNTPQ